MLPRPRKRTVAEFCEEHGCPVDVNSGPSLRYALGCVLAMLPSTAAGSSGEENGGEEGGGDGWREQVVALQDKVEDAERLNEALAAELDRRRIAIAALEKKVEARALLRSILRSQPGEDK